MAPSIPKTMKAAQLVEFKQDPAYQINKLPVSAPSDNDVLIKIGAAGFCHTDYQVWEGVYESPCPIVPSHEPVGTIVAVGTKAAVKWKVGQRVGALLFRHACKHYVKCQTTNDIRFCENGDFAGLKNNGGMAEYMIGDADDICELPEQISFVQGAPLMCAGATVWGGIGASKVMPGEAIGIIGVGGLGTLAVKLAKALGHPVIAIDNRPEGRELATAFSLKADLVIDSNDPSAISTVKQFAGKAGLSALMVCTDNIPVNEWALKLLRPHGVLVPLGLPADGFHFNAFDLVFQELVIVGSLVATQVEAQKMLNTVAKYGVRSHITEIPLERAGELPTLYMDQHLKGRLVVKVSDE